MRAICIFFLIASGFVSAQSSTGCQKNVSFAVFEAGQINPRVPKFTNKWISKNQKKYPGICFSQAPAAGARNYLFVFSTSQSSFNGIYPSVRTNTTTNITPVSGTGTATSNYGDVWTYSYSGTETTTTTTQTQVDLPYTDTSNTLYLHAYRWNGTLASNRWRTVTSRQGGDATNTLGYNLGAALGAIHVKERLLGDAVKDLDADCEHGQSDGPACSLQTAVQAAPNVTEPPVQFAAAREPAQAPAKASSPCDAAIRSNVSGEFEGWGDEKIYKLDNGQVWQQSGYHYHYHYAYRPEVIIYKTSSGTCHLFVVEDEDQGVEVERLK